MDKRKNQLLQLTSIGLILVALTQVIWHYLEIPDFYNGLLIGVGIGLMLFSLKKNRKKQNS